MTQSVEGGFQVDVTNEVLDFLNRGHDEEHTVVVPGLHVVALDGVVRATQRTYETSCYHLYEDTTVSEAPEIPVQRLWVGGPSWQGVAIETTQGNIPGDKDALRGYRFVMTEQVREQNEDERVLHERLTQLPFLVAQEPGRLIGYDKAVYVSPADPLGSPISVPKNTQFGYADPVLHTKVRSFSLFTDEEGVKQVALSVPDALSPSVTRHLAPVPLEKLRFEVEPEADLKRALFGRAVRLSEGGVSGKLEELQELIATFNGLPSDDYSMSLHRETEYPNEGVYRGMIGYVEDGQITGVRPPSVEELRTNYSPDRLVLEPRTQQLYIVDEQANRAFSATHLGIYRTSAAE